MIYSGFILKYELEGEGGRIIRVELYLGKLAKEPKPSYIYLSWDSLTIRR